MAWFFGGIVIWKVSVRDTFPRTTETQKYKAIQWPLGKKFYSYGYVILLRQVRMSFKMWLEFVKLNFYLHYDNIVFKNVHLDSIELINNGK